MLGMCRLAVQVEGHSIEDLGHEDLDKPKAPRSRRVETWDQGTYELLSKDEDQLVLRFHGEKLKGLYGLFRVKRRKGSNWLLIRAAEE